ncbi:substrate-binding domain-containing protein [Microbacterium sp. NPDC058345]|uniref:substrate-binding domain-containing protein n=1 Tax=Microbacterium sp. NPDC058345 TaxID=3346455 RepID=UPI0036493273
MKGISSMATRHLLTDLAEAASVSGLPRVRMESMGGVDAARRVAAGEPCDLVFLAADALAALAAGGHLDQSTVTELVISQVAVAVGASEDSVAVRPAAPAFPDAAAMRAALQAATRIGYSTGPSGTALVRMIEAWGLADAIRPKLVQARPGVPVASLVAQGEVDLGFQQLSELVGQTGIRLLGVLPGDATIDTVFAGAVSARSSHAMAARSVLDWFVSAPASSIVEAHSFRPAGSGS